MLLITGSVPLTHQERQVEQERRAQTREADWVLQSNEMNPGEGEGLLGSLLKDAG